MDTTVRPVYKYIIKRTKTGEIVNVSQGVFVLGRSETSCDYVITGNRTIGRKHAILINKGDSCSITDNNSTNKTFLNEVELIPNQGYELHDGDIFRLSDEKFIFSLIEG